MCQVLDPYILYQFIDNKTIINENERPLTGKENLYVYIKPK